MWESISNLLRLIPSLVRELPEQVRTPAAAAWCIVGLVAVLIVLLPVTALSLPNDHWAKTWLIGVLASVAILLLVALGICAVFIVVSVVARFFGKL